MHLKDHTLGIERHALYTEFCIVGCFFNVLQVNSNLMLGRGCHYMKHFRPRPQNQT